MVRLLAWPKEAKINFIYSATTETKVRQDRNKNGKKNQFMKHKRVIGSGKMMNKTNLCPNVLYVCLLNVE